MSFTIDGEAQRAEAGLFRLRETDTMSGASEVILAWCLEVQQALDIPTEYQVNSIPPSAEVAENLNRLFSTSFFMVRQNSNDLRQQGNKAAGFQLAIWEIVSDSGDLDLGAGAFQVTDDATRAGVLANAETYLARTQRYENMMDNGNIRDRDQTFEYTYYNSDTSQDLIRGERVAAVPVPAAGLLLLSGLAGFAAMRRRRKS